MLRPAVIFGLSGQSCHLWESREDLDGFVGEVPLLGLLFIEISSSPVQPTKLMVLLVDRLLSIAWRGDEQRTARSPFLL